MTEGVRTLRQREIIGHIHVHFLNMALQQNKDEKFGKKPTALLTSSPFGSVTSKGSLHMSMPVVSRSAPPLHGKPSKGDESSPSQSLFP